LFSLYFQSFSSTWAPVETLRRVYDTGLAEEPFVELTVGTRPDCIDPAVADLLASYRTPAREVWVELGLQSSRDATLARIGRGHDVGAFRRAAALLRDRGLPFTAHLMYGLPGESKGEFLDSVAFAVAEGASGIKLHDLILVPGTALYGEWQAGRLDPVDPEAYLDAAAEALARLPAHVVVWRVCSDPEDRKGPAIPGEKWPKNRFLNRLKAEVVKRRGP
jgi:radical SAM protein (TIGR01212 family)